MGTKKLEVGALQREAVALIREAMSREGVSGRAVADRAGVTVSRCAAILRNERVMTVDEFVAIAGVLGLTPWRLLREAEERLDREASASAVAVDVDAGSVVVPMRRRGVYGSGQVVEELPEGALGRAAAQVVEGDVEDEVEGFGRRP